MSDTGPDISETKQTAELTQARWREEFLRIVLPAASILGLVAGVASVIDVLQSGNTLLAFVYGGAWLVLLAVTVGRWPYAVRAGTLLALLYALGVTGLLENGMRGDARLFFFALSVMMAILVSPRAGYAAIAATLFTTAVVGALTLTGGYRLMS